MPAASLFLRPLVVKGWCLFLQRHHIVVAVKPFSEENKSGGQGAGKLDYLSGAQTLALPAQRDLDPRHTRNALASLNRTPPGDVFKSSTLGEMRKPGGHYREAAMALIFEHEQNFYDPTRT